MAVGVKKKLRWVKDKFYPVELCWSFVWKNFVPCTTSGSYIEAGTVVDLFFEKNEKIEKTKENERWTKVSKLLFFFLFLVSLRVFCCLVSHFQLFGMYVSVS